MRRILFMTMLLTVMAARGQTYSYRYWFDNNTAAVVSGSATGEAVLTMNVSGLSLDHIHALRMQVYKDERWSSVRTSYFLCPITATHQTNATGRYWFDNDVSTVQTAPTVDGLIDLDVSGLKTGMHAVHYQTYAADGTASVVRTQYFLLTDYNGERLTCEFWVDDDKDHSQWLQIKNNEVEVDISSLEKGNHNVTLCVYDGAGILTARETLEFTVIEAAPVTVTAKDYTIKYGDEIPAFEFTSDGAALEGTPSITCEATSASPVGTYPIVISKGGVTNYNVTYVNGTLAIEKAPLRITAKDYTIKQGEVLPTFEATYEGFKNNETSDVLTKQPVLSTTATSASEPGEYEITVSGGEAQNYEIAHVNGKLTITEASGIIGISVDNPMDIYDLQGNKVRYRATSLEGLPKGVYIINGKKIIIR